MSERSIRLPFPPSINEAFAHKVIKGRAIRHRSKKYMAWQEEAIVRLIAQRWPRYEVPVIIKLELTPGTAVGRDCDNYFKAPIDALVKARVLKDDSFNYVRGVMAWWNDPAPTAPGLVIHIRPVKVLTRPMLMAGERKALNIIRKAGVLLVGPSHKVTLAQQGLIAKGYIIPQQGLLYGQPQGYVVA